MTSTLTYSPAGATRPEDPDWNDQLPGFRRFERTIVIGRGAEFWEAVSQQVLRWEIKRRSGFRVQPGDGASDRVAAGGQYVISAAFGPLTVREPVLVVQVVDLPHRRGFAYGTQPGHPVSGEEAFIVHTTPDGTVYLTLRSLTRPAPSGPWRTAFPALLVAQQFYRRRYLRALAA
ncbi:DUF1990 domain-containing protein [Nocardia huaxiensis]|uniref:DUF1990 domain-containing protein n=1 Tax=Nocardia huaxiensis TaxID=2755382 RepID=A0A7D6Z7D8_9NOCA|nr:DUF1990 domain-containing protein [Nocardia huaxiensis]QLY28728.1 DUF1990 domain-containing protein [Nocardia huaxiensis]